MTWLFSVLLLLIWHSCYIDSHICMSWLFMYFCHTDYCYLNIFVLLLHEYFLNIVHDYFLYHCIDMKLLLPGHIIYWCLMCETKCHVEATKGATSRISHLLFPVILFSDTKTAYVMLSCYIMHALLFFLIHCNI